MKCYEALQALVVHFSLLLLLLMDVRMCHLDFGEESTSTRL